MNEIDPADLTESLVELGAAWWRLHVPTGRLAASPNCANVLGLAPGVELTASRLRALRPFPARGWVRMEAVHNGPDDRVRSRLAARTDHRGEITHVVGLELPFSTVTEPGGSEHVSDADGQLLRDIFAVQPAMVARYRSDSTVVWCNEAYAAHLGVARRDVRGRRWIDLAADRGYDSIATMEQLLADILATTPADTTSTVLAPMPGDMGMRWIQWSNRLLPGAADDGGDLVQAIGVEVTELRTARDALDAMARELVRGRVSERRELARRLHDDVVQVLVSAMWAMSPSEGHDVAADSAQRAADLVRMAIEQLRGCLGELTASAVQPSSIAEVLDREMEPLRTAGVEIDMTLGDVVDEELRTVATRVLVEAVRNVHRHARATSVSVSLRGEGDVVVGRVTDNGVGARDEDLTRALAAGHVGLLMARAMVESIGGTFSFRGTGRSGGTVVEFEAPRWPSRSRTTG